MPARNQNLATTLGLLEEISTADSGHPYFVRVFAVPEAVLECGGTIQSCPNVKLYITFSTGDLGDPPVLFQLPSSKGWEFMGWSRPTEVEGVATVGFTVRTALPGSNIEEQARKTWRPRVYSVQLSPASATVKES
jgi:hypothetical protein